ncbi:MAG: GNAT family N-acetyltransferase [Rickettsiales bacterium]|nr:GNAT family N-acetyltransferase [Rickettsiales bacterium]
MLENGIYYIKKGCGKNLLKDFLEIEKEAPNYKNNTDSFSENKTYYVVYKNNKAVAATTIKQSDKDILQIQKITVLEEYKKNDIKTDLLKFVLQDNFINRKKIRIQTQFHLKEQYNDFCFEETGEKYLKGEVEFIDMEADVEILQKQNYERKNNLISNVMDIYILSKLKIAIENIKKSMDNYAPAAACRESEEFFETLNNWYIRRNKGRFWKSEIDDDKQYAYSTLYTILITMSKTIAPVLPFTSEYVYRGLNNN